MLRVHQQLTIYPSPATCNLDDIYYSSLVRFILLFLELLFVFFYPRGTLYS